MKPIVVTGQEVEVVHGEPCVCVEYQDADGLTVSKAVVPPGKLELPDVIESVVEHDSAASLEAVEIAEKYR